MITEDGDIINEYNTIRFNGVSKDGHILAFVLQFGRLPSPGEYVIHGCDRKCCCNPAHVRSGSPKENHAEAVERGLIDPQAGKGRPRPHVQGEHNIMAKASNRQAAEIKWLIENKEVWFTNELSKRYRDFLEVLAITYQLSLPTVKRMRSKESWKNVTPIPPEELPNADKIPVDAKPPMPQKDGPIGPDNARQILLGYWAEANKPGYVRQWAKSASGKP